MKNRILFYVAVIGAMGCMPAQAANYDYIAAGYTNTKDTNDSTSGPGYTINISHSLFNRFFIAGGYEHDSLNLGAGGGGLFIKVIDARLGYHLPVTDATDLVFSEDCRHFTDDYGNGGNYSYMTHTVECSPEAGLRSSLTDRLEVNAFMYSAHVVGAGPSDWTVSVGTLYDLGNRVSIGAKYLQTTNGNYHRQWLAEIQWAY